jgi:hypothetical protein
MGGAPKCSEEEFIGIFKRFGPAGTSEYLKCDLRAVYGRRRAIEQRRGISLDSPDYHGTNRPGPEYPDRLHIKVDTGTVLCGSDMHLWPGDRSVSVRAFIVFAKELKPKAVIVNGDVLDLARISKFARSSGRSQFGFPTVKEEIETGQSVLHDIRSAAPKNCETIWCEGNHDFRLEKFVCQEPELANLVGTRLEDYFPLWRMAMSCWINNDVVVKHDIKGGMYATRQNTLVAGKNTVTGHLHQSRVWRTSDYNERPRYAVDCGMMSYPYGPQFRYMRDNPRDWAESFAVLKFVKGVLLQPQLCIRHDDNHVDYCGELIRV